MSTKKFEKLIDLIINEDQEAARALFHDIVVEKSRTIYESLLEDETSSLDDEISAEETGSMDDAEYTDDEEMDGDYDVDGEEGEFEIDDEESVDMDDEDMGEEPAELEDRLVDVEDKLDQLMAEFEAQMGGDDDEEVDVDFESDEEVDEEDSGIMEAIELKKIAGLYDGKISSDYTDGSKKGPVAANSGQKGMDSRPVNFDQGGQTATPTSTPKPSNYGTKGESEVKDANQWENRPSGDAGKSAFTKKADRQYGQKDTDSGKLVGADGSIATDNRSPVPESRRTTKRRI